MLGCTARFPDALVGLAPDLGGALGLRFDDRPQATRQPVRVAGVEEDRVEHGAEHVVLTLVERAVADSYRASAGVPGEIVARRLGEIATSVDPVHDLERSVLGGLDVGDELHELVGFPVERQEVQRLQGEGRVTHPGVAVVPVSFAARRLGQRRRERGNGGAGRHVGEALDGEGGPLDRIAPTVVRDPGASDPGTPEPDRPLDPRVGIVDVGRRREVMGPRQRAVGLVARFERVSGANAVALDPEREVRLQAQRQAIRGRIGGAVAAVDERPLGGCSAVVEGRLADQLDLHAPVDAFDGPDEHVFGVVVGRWPGVRCDQVVAVARSHRERVADDDPAGGGLPRGDEHVGARLVSRVRRDD